jgi:hypothetical protein
MTSLLCHAVAAFLLCGAADDPEDKQETPVAREDSNDRAQRLAFLTERASEYQLFVKGDQAVKMTAQPVFRWSHPIAKLDDAAVFLWMTDGEPVALGTMILHGELGLFSEFQSVSSGRVKAVKKDATVWEPTKGCQFSTLPGAPKPAATAAERLTQMKALSRRFTMELTKGQPVYSEDSTWQLRLLPKQLARFGGSKRMPSDGALFVFCHDTDPEVVLLLRTSDSEWEFACAPLTGWAAEAKCDERVVWSQERLNPVDDPKLPYIKFGPEPVTTKFPSLDGAKK